MRNQRADGGVVFAKLDAEVCRSAHAAHCRRRSFPLTSDAGQRMRAQVSVPVTRPAAFLIDNFNVLLPSEKAK